jgi:hypothetical protein
MQSDELETLTSNNLKQLLNTIRDSPGISIAEAAEALATINNSKIWAASQKE